MIPYYVREVCANSESKIHGYKTRKGIIALLLLLPMGGKILVLAIIFGFISVSKGKG